MKIGILTFHRATNYGTVLQAYAMVCALRKLGLEAELIDYRPEYNERTMRTRKLRNAHSIKEIASIVLNFLIYGNHFKNKIEKFGSFIDKMPCSSDVYRTTEEVAAAMEQYDVLLSGSDQLWNERITGNDLTYFFPFHHPCKISYASSFGVSEISDKRKEEILPLLSVFLHISVREKTAEQIIKRLFSLYSSAPVNELLRVVDPTLLLEAKEWGELKALDISLPEDGYILTYYMIETPLLRSITKKLQNETGLPVVNLKPSKKQMVFREGMNMLGAGPAEFISCYVGAKYVVTNSFHGTAFAINFNIPFYVAPLPFSMAGDVNSRLIEILEWYDISERFISTPESVKTVSSAERLKDLENIRNVRKNESMEILIEMLRKAYEHRGGI